MIRKYLIILFDCIIVAIHRVNIRLLPHWRNVVASYVSFDSNVIIGRCTYGINQDTISLAPSINPPSVVIGSFCSIAPGVVILANADHPTSLPSTFPFRTLLFNQYFPKRVNFDAVSRGSIEIGHDVWIGQNTIVLSGVIIGTGAIIGAGSLVTKDIPPYAIAVGNPAKVVRYRFPPETISRLLESEWWLLSDDKLIELEPFFYSIDVDNFLIKVAQVKCK